MKIPRQRYTEEFRHEAVKQVEAGNKPATVAKQLGINEITMSNWSKVRRNGRLAATVKVLRSEQDGSFTTANRTRAPQDGE